MASTDVSVTVTTLPKSESRETWKHVVIVVILFAIVIFTITSNLIVLIAFCLEKKLRNTFGFFIANLATTDLMLGLTSMTFYTINTVLGYWPFGQFMCGVWLFFDFCVVFSSIFTLVAISVDRYWAVIWGLNYRKHNNKRKSATIITCIWVLAVILCMPTCIIDRIKWSVPKTCWWDPSKNVSFAYFISVVGHHLTCLVITFCYVRVCMFMRKQFTIRPGTDNPRLIRVVPSTSACTSSGMVTTRARTQISTIASESTEQKDKHNDNAPRPQQQKPARVTTDAQDDSQERFKQEKKLFVTMSFILIAYMICWVPFNIVFSFSILAPDLVSPAVYTLVFWMTYLNSIFNPILYSFSNKEFRKAIIRVISFKHSS